MKRNKMLESMDLLDEAYIEEADPRRGRHKKRSFLRWSAVAACFLMLFSAVGAWLFLPFSNEPADVSRYSDSAYYPIILKLNAIARKNNTYGNNFELYFSGLGMTKGDDSINLDYGSPDRIEMPTSGAPTRGEEEEYQEVTDNQVEGVVEADLIKRSDKYIYYIRRGKLSVYSIAGEASREVGYFLVTPPEGRDSSYYYNQWQMYLSKDCKTMTVLAPYGNKDGAHITILSLDVSDPANIKLKDSVTVTGSYKTSRMVDGKLLLLSYFYVGSDPDFSDESTFLPQIDMGEGPESIPMEDIVSPDTLTNRRYTVVCKLDEQSLSLEGCSAFLSYSDQVYVSDNSVYVTRTYHEEENEKGGEGLVRRTTMTEISRLCYAGDSFEHKGSVSVAGYVKDQYSLDENKGILRVVTTTDSNLYKPVKTDVSDDVFGVFYDVSDDVFYEIPQGEQTGTNASLYCIDLAPLQVVAKVENFAPWGETVRSVRFDGDSAYVCTSIQLSDPVFFFDLSDLENITYKDTGTIEGFSSSLVNFGDGFLLGIGIGSDWNTVKIEVYEETENGVVSVSSFEYKDASYSTEYKSYLIDRENRLVGLGITHYNGSSRYVLLHFDNYQLHERVNVVLNGADENKRAVYIDEYLYIFGPEFDPDNFIYLRP